LLVINFFLNFAPELTNHGALAQIPYVM